MIKRKLYLEIFFQFIFILLLNFQFFKFDIVTKLYIVCFVTFLYVSRHSLRNNFNKHKKDIYLSVFWLIPNIMSITYSDNLINGFNNLKNLIPLLITPIVYFLLDNKVKERLFSISKTIFPLSTLLFGFFIIVKLNYYFYDPYVIQYGKPVFLDYVKFVYEHRFGYLNNTSEIQVFIQFFHKAYYSISLLISLMFLLYWKNNVKKSVMIGLILLLLMLFKSLPQIFISILLLLLYTLKKIKYKRVFLTSIILISSACFIFYYNKIITIFFSTLENRDVLFNCSIEYIKSNIFLGVGIGDSQDLLNQCYNVASCNDCLTLNSHNQYIDLLLSSGFLGLTFFIIFMYIVLRNSILKKQYFLGGLMIVFIFSFLFENIFSRMWGVILFSIFYSMFYNKTNLEKDE